MNAAGLKSRLAELEQPAHLSVIVTVTLLPLSSKSIRRKKEEKDHGLTVDIDRLVAERVRVGVTVVAAEEDIKRRTKGASKQLTEHCRTFQTPLRQ